MTEYLITDIRRATPKGSHRGITHLYGPKGDGHIYVDTVLRCSGYIESGRHRFFLEREDAKIYVEVRTEADGQKYLQAKVDGVWTDDLLTLPHKDMEEYEITKVQRSDPNGSHESITYLSGPELVKSWPDYLKKLSFIVDYIETEKFNYFVNGKGGRAEVLVRETKDGQKYVQARRDGAWTDDLLALPAG